MLILTKEFITGRDLNNKLGVIKDYNKCVRNSMKKHRRKLVETLSLSHPRIALIKNPFFSEKCESSKFDLAV